MFKTVAANQAQQISSFKERLMYQLIARTQEELDQRLENMMKELDLMYDKNCRDDFMELAYIMCQLLQYPSSDVAEMHSNANLMRNHQEVQGCLRCPCCGMNVIEQNSKFLSQCQYNEEIQNNLDQFTFQKAFYLQLFLLTLMFIIFSIYSVASNYIISASYKRDIGQSINDQSFRTYQFPVSFSFGSAQYYSTSLSQISIIIQGWLGVLMLIVWIFCIIYYQIYMQSKMENYFSQSAAHYTLLCLKLSTQFIDQQKKLQQHLNNQVNTKINNGYQEPAQSPQPKVEVQIQKINWVIPWNIETISQQSKQNYHNKVEEINQKKQIFKQWLIDRKSSTDFKVDEVERRKQYKIFNELRQQRYILYENIIQERQGAINKMLKANKITNLNAFVTFRSATTPQQILNTQQRRLIPFPEMLYAYGCEYDNWWVVAPQPQQVFWRKLGIKRNCAGIFGGFLLFFAQLVFLGICFFSDYRVAEMKVNSKTKGEDNFTLDLINSMVNFVLNQIIKFQLSFLNNIFQLSISQSEYQISLARKLILAQLINSILLPTSINLIIKNNIYGVDGLADSVFYFALTNAILTLAFKLIDIFLGFIKVGNRYSNLVCKKWDKNQKQLNKDSQYMPFDIGLRYAQVIFIFLYTCFFASLQPIIVVFSATAIFLIYHAEMFIKLNLASRHSPNRTKVIQKLTSLIYFGPVLYVAGSFLWTDMYATEVAHIRVTNLIGFVLGLLSLCLIIIPVASKKKLFSGLWKRFKMCLQDSDEEAYQNDQLKSRANYGQFKENQSKFASDYDLQNPETKQKARRNYNKKFCDEKMKGSIKMRKIVEMKQIGRDTFDDESYLRHRRYFDLPQK